MKYTILRHMGTNDATTLVDLNEAVNRLIAKGYRPQGGVQLVKDGNLYLALQAMVLQGESE